jgi:hypothetical protein
MLLLYLIFMSGRSISFGSNTSDLEQICIFPFILKVFARKITLRILDPPRGTPLAKDNTFRWIQDVRG